MKSGVEDPGPIQIPFLHRRLISEICNESLRAEVCFSPVGDGGGEGRDGGSEVL